MYRNGPVGESETATPALALAYCAFEVSDGPSAWTHRTHWPVDSLYTTFGRSRIAALTAGSVWTVPRSRYTAARSAAE
ncbi:hypothetical protein D3C74_424410 [compost metagenome]